MHEPLHILGIILYSLSLEISAGRFHRINILDNRTIIIPESVLGDLSIPDFSEMYMTTVRAVYPVISVQGGVQFEIKILSTAS